MRIIGYLICGILLWQKFSQRVATDKKFGKISKRYTMLFPYKRLPFESAAVKKQTIL